MKGYVDNIEKLVRENTNFRHVLYTAEHCQYVFLKAEDRKYLDPEIYFYAQKNDFTILQVMPNYMEDDPESENYGVVMYWRNPDYQEPPQ